MELYIDYPFLSMIYQDGYDENSFLDEIFHDFYVLSLLLWICDSTLDQKLSGTRERPHILLRFNTLSTHQSTQNASVRFIVHNGFYRV